MSTGQRVLDVLKALGPMTGNEIAAELRITRQSLDSAVSTLRKGKAKRVYIREWCRKVGASGREYAVYALGNKPDAAKPVFERSSVQKRYDEKLRAVRRIQDHRRNGNPLDVFSQMVRQVGGVPVGPAVAENATNELEVML